MDPPSAQRFLADRVAWLDEAQVWSGILRPFRHHGAANYLDRGRPGLLFESMMPANLCDDPVVALTTSGWKVEDGLDMNRVREFGAGVLAVRASMTGVPGLRSQQSFFFPAVLDYDPLTVTFWRDEASIRAFAYGQGSHRRQLDRHRAEGLADRTSFTRFHVLSSAGTWYGVDPAALDRAPRDAQPGSWRRRFHSRDRIASEFGDSAMYVPAHFEGSEPARLHALVAAHPLGILVTRRPGGALHDRAPDAGDGTPGRQPWSRLGDHHARGRGGGPAHRYGRSPVSGDAAQSALGRGLSLMSRPGAGSSMSRW